MYKSAINILFGKNSLGQNQVSRTEYAINFSG